MTGSHSLNGSLKPLLPRQELWKTTKAAASVVSVDATALGRSGKGHKLVLFVVDVDVPVCFQTFLSFLVYNWDGQSPAGDRTFLGAAHLELTVVCFLWISSISFPIINVNLM